MPRVEPLPREELAEFEPFFQLAEGAMGFVPNSLLTLGHSPALLLLCRNRVRYAEDGLSGPVESFRVRI
jgi:hypothetical protein